MRFPVAAFLTEAAFFCELAGFPWTTLDKLTGTLPFHVRLCGFRPIRFEGLPAADDLLSAMHFVVVGSWQVQLEPTTQVRSQQQRRASEIARRFDGPRSRLWILGPAKQDRAARELFRGHEAAGLRSTRFFPASTILPTTLHYFPEAESQKFLSPRGDSHSQSVPETKHRLKP